MAKRILSTDSSNQTEIENSLNNYDPFILAHLIKFEKPLSLNRAKNRGAPNYSYLTDNSYDIEYRDGSKDEEGELNPPQTYRANKIVGLGTINENIVAKAAQISLTLDTNALGSSASSTGAFDNSENTFAGDVDLSEEGFQEGDTITFNGVDAKFTIQRFFNSGKSIEYTVDKTITLSETSATYTVTLASEILNALLTEKNADAAEYSSYINREIFIYKAHINPETRQIIGEPFLYFKGIIVKGKIQETLTGSKLTWTLSSHWGDFERVGGRISDDSIHRALDSRGLTDQNALIRDEYKGDFGFIHANTAVYQNVKYIGYETRYKQVDINGSWPGGKRLREYQEEVDRNTFLDIQLKSKYIPVVYGVRKIEGFPVFVDTAANDTKQVFKADVLCEGPIASIYDIIVDGQGIICNDKTDNDTRGDGNFTDDEQPAQVCFGNRRRGDVLLKSQPGAVETCVDALASEGVTQVELGSFGDDAIYITSQQFCERENPAVGGAQNYQLNATEIGIVHDQQYRMPSPTPMQTTLRFKSGLANQNADETLSYQAALGYTIQNNFYEDTKYNIPYWGPSHRLLDTAYVAQKMTIADGETTIPDGQYVVKGKFIECHHYDSTYQVQTRAGASEDNFNIGDLVDVHAFPGAGADQTPDSSDTKIGDQIRITDKFSTVAYSQDSQFGKAKVVTRYKFDTSITLTDTPYFYMKKGSDYLYFRNAGEIKLNSSIQQPLLLSAALTTASQAAGTNRGVKVTLDGATSTRFKDTLDHFDSEDNATVYLRFYTGTGANEAPASTMIGSYSYSSGVIDDLPLHTNKTYTRVEMLNAIALNLTDGGNVLDTASSDTNDEYLGDHLVFRNVYTEDTENEWGVLPLAEEISTAKRITAYLGGNTNVAVVDSIFEGPLPGHDEDYHSQAYKIFAGEGNDLRVSTNPAMQLLDYMTSKRYGQGLDLEEDIDLDSFKAAALKCDERSDVSVFTTSTSAFAADQLWQYPAPDDVTASNPIRFMGTVRTVGDEITVDGVTGKLITFKDCIGKLGRKWNNYEAFPTNELYWYDGKIYVGDGTVKTTKPDGTGNSYASGLTIGKAGTTGAANEATLNTTLKSANGNPLVKGYDSVRGNMLPSGYSLYDSDDVEYWRYAGWDDNQQRNVTRHQMNQTIDTQSPVFDNIQKMLPQFNGVLRYSAGKYTLSIKGKKPTLDAVEQISEDDIIGTISLDDGGLKQSKNYMSTSIIDPQANFEGRSVTFFNSNYLKQDKGIQKKGNVSTPGITNYYNARMQVEQALNESRYGLTINFTMSPKALLLTAGSVIEITYPRFGFNPREFRILNINYKKDGTADITAREHNDTVYKLTEELSPAPTRGKDNEIDVGKPDAPTSLQWVPNKASGFGFINLTWVNSSTWNKATHLTEVYRSRNSSHSATLTAGNFVVGQFYTIKTTGTTSFTDIGAADNNPGTIFMATGVGTGTGTVDELVFVGTSDSNMFEDNIITGTDMETRYYWIRYRVKRPAFNTSGSNFRDVFSDYQPATSASGIAARTTVNPTNLSRAVQLSTPNDARSFTYNNDGTTPSPASLVITATPINAGGGTTNYEFFVDGSSVQDSSTATYTYTPQASMADMPQNISVTLTHTFEGTDYTAEDNITLSASVLTEINGSLLADNTVNTDQLAANSVNTTIVAGNAVTNSEISGNSVNNASIAQNSVNAASIAQNAVTATQIAANSVNANEIVANAVTATQIAANSVNANEIVANAVTATQIAANSVNANEIVANAVTGTQVSSSTTITAGSGTDVAVLDGADSTYRIYAGHSTPGSAPFSVTKEGAITATNATITGKVTANEFSRLDGRPVQEVNEGTKIVSQATLAPRVIMRGGLALFYSVLEDNTRIFQNNDLILTKNKGDKGSINSSNLSQGDIFHSDKPVTLRENGSPTPSLANTGTVFTTSSPTSKTHHHFGMYAPYADGTMKYFVDTTETPSYSIDFADDNEYDASTNPNGWKSVALTESSVATLTIDRPSASDDGIYWFYSDTPVAMIQAASNTSTYTDGGTHKKTMKPCAYEILSYDGNDPIKFDPSSTDTIEESQATGATSWTYNRSSTLFGVSDHGDGHGSDGSQGIPWKMCGDTYMLDHGIRNYQLATIEPCIVSVYYYDTGNGWTFYKSHDFSAASRTNFLGATEGDNDYQGHTSTVGEFLGPAYNTRPWRFIGTGRFALRTNDGGGDEYIALGYDSNLRSQQTIRAGNIVAGDIAANAVTADKIAANSVDANEIVANAVTATEIAANSINANEIVANAVTATQIAANSVNANEIVANAVTATQIAVNSINANEIVANAITGTQVSSSTTLLAGTQVGLDGTGTGDTTVRIFAGDTLANKDTAPFRVQQDGDLIAADANISGVITATSLSVTDPDAIQEITAKGVADGAITEDSFGTSAISFIQEEARTASGGSAGVNELRSMSTVLSDANFDDDDQIADLDITDLTHGTNDPIFSIIPVFSIYTANYYDGTDLDMKFKVYARTNSPQGSWTALNGGNEITITAFRQIRPWAPAASKFHYSAYTIKNFTETTLTDNTDFDYKVEVTKVPVWYDSQTVTGSGSIALQVIEAGANATLAGLEDVTLTSEAAKETLVYGGSNWINTDVLSIDTTNNRVGVNDTTPSVALEVTGEIKASGNITAYSDERLKDDVKTLDGKKVLEMRGVEFTKDGEKGSGVIAQELEKVAPELVANEGKYKSVAYGNLVGYLIEAIKDLQKQVDELKK